MLFRRKLEEFCPVEELQQSPASSSPSSTYIQMYGHILRLVFIDTSQGTQGELCGELCGDLASRILRHNLTLVLLCADFNDVSSFNAMWGLDNQVLDSLDVDVMWVRVWSPLSVLNAYRRSHTMISPPVVTQSNVRRTKRSIRSDRDSVVSLFGESPPCAEQRYS